MEVVHVQLDKSLTKPELHVSNVQQIVLNVLLLPVPHVQLVIH